MNRKEYLAKRAKLLEEAQNLINEGKLQEYEAKEKEIKDLDTTFEAAAKAQANINALKDQIPATGIVEDMASPEGVIDSTKTKEPVDRKKEYLNAWAKRMMGLKLSDAENVVFDQFNAGIKNAAQTAATHAVVIPETVVKGIWKEAGELFPILGDTRMTFVPGDMTIIKETDSGDDADWYDEATAVTDGDFGFGELNLTGCELSKSIPVSWKLRKMSIDAFIPYITSLLAEKMGAALAKAIVSGKGKPGVGDTFKAQPKGIVTALEAETNTPQVLTYDGTATLLEYGLLATAMGKIKSTYKTGAAIYAKSATIWGILAQIKDEMGRPIFVPDVSSGGVGRIFGLLVKEEDSVAADAVLAGNVSRGYACNVNEDMTVYTEDHIKDRYTDYMSYSIVDGDVLTAKAFAYIKKVTT